MRGEIINIGTELLLGDTLNTHAQFLSSKLSNYGIDLYYHTTVGDNSERVKAVTQLALSRSELIIFTAGLGPTKDDLTKEIVCEALGVELEFKKELMDKIESFFKKKNKPMTDNNIKQAYIPKGAHIIPNELGTACGIILEYKGKHIIMLPGPIHEFEHVYNSGVDKYLKKISQNHIYSEKILVSGLGESYIENAIMDLIDKQTSPTIATYAKNAYTEIRLTAKANSFDKCLEQIRPLKLEIEKRFSKNLYIIEDYQANFEKVFRLLTELDLKLGVAESFTGGKLSDLFTRKAGASKFFELGLVTYSNQSKKNLLGVSQELIDAHTEVSSEVALAMVNGLISKYNVDIAIATTGLAGPTDGGLNIPVGKVYFALATKQKQMAYEYQLKGSRIDIQDQMLKEIIKKLIDLLESL